MSTDTRQNNSGFPAENKDKSATNQLDAESNCLRGPMTLVNDSCGNKNLDNYVLLYDSGKTIASGVNGNNKTNSSCKRRLNLHRLNAVVIGEPIDISDDEDNCDDNRSQNVHTQICNDYICGGELVTHVPSGGHFIEDDVQFYIAEIVIALERLHKLGIIYRDLKLENTLLDSDGHIVSTDFGLSKVLTNDSNGKSYSCCGTLQYMAPEMINKRGTGHDFGVDWWALGVLCYELLTGDSPFEDCADRNNSEGITKRILKASPPLSFYVIYDAEDLITGLLEKEPSKRLGSGPTGVDDVKAHRFFLGIDWEKLAKKEIPAPYKPFIKDELDTRNFHKMFTKMPVVDKSCEPPPNHERSFRGFSFVAPNHLN